MYIHDIALRVLKLKWLPAHVHSYPWPPAIRIRAGLEPRKLASLPAAAVTGRVYTVCGY